MKAEIRRRPLAAPPLAAAPPALRDIYRRRGVRDAAELDLSLEGLPNPDRLGGLTEATRLLLESRRRKICLVGDYDADGACGCALGLLGLRAMGFAELDYIVPDRRLDGYGLTPALVERALAQGAELIVTVDNGVAAVEGVARARAENLRVIVTDHHLPGASLPEADAIINPKLSPDFGGANLAGVGVMFYLLVALRAALRVEGGVDCDLRGWLDLVALGTVADMVKMDHCNRILVHQGLRRIRGGRMRPGLEALLDCAKKNRAEVDERALGFSLAPRINAAGRLDDIALSVECLLADDAQLAREYAGALDDINRERRAITAAQRDEAEASLTPEIEGELPAGLCVHDPDWHIGVIGLIASHLARRHHRPSVALALDGDGALVGSARSVDGVHVRDVLEAAHVAEGDLFQRFGGHAQAAGFSMAAERLPDFERAFAREVAAAADAEALQPHLWSDGELRSEQISVDTAQQLAEAGPWGVGFPSPCFDGRFTVLRRLRRGRDRSHLAMRVRAADGGEFDAIWFGADAEFMPEADVDETPLAVRALYQLSAEEWRGQPRLQLMVQALAAV